MIGDLSNVCVCVYLLYISVYSDSHIDVWHTCTKCGRRQNKQETSFEQWEVEDTTSVEEKFEFAW